MEHYDVIVSGAGLAGLASARTLIQNGVSNVLVLEAKERVGGRVRTESVRGHPFDHGAQWLHGRQRNRLYELAQRRDLLAHGQVSTEGEGHFLTDRGRCLDPTVVEEARAVVRQVLDNLDPDILDKRVENIDQVLEEVGQRFPAGLMGWHRNYQLIDNACWRLDELPIDAWNEYDECDGDYCQTVKRGFSSLVDELVREIPAKCISLSRPVQRVDWNSNSGFGTCCNNNKSFGDGHGPPVVVTLADSTQLSCNHLIITWSAGFLKAHQGAMFHPALPSEWTSALERCIGFGPVTKILLVFESPFWNAECKGFQFVWTDLDGGEAVEPWWHYLTGFDVVPCDGPDGLLLGWVGGAGAAHLDRSDVADVEIGRQCQSLLRRFTGRQDIPAPRTVARTSWSRDPYTLGAYSYRKAVFDPVLLQPIGPAVDNQRSARVPSLVFAGEALHPSHYSTAHGAFECGQDQALKVVRFIQDQRCPPQSAS